MIDNSLFKATLIFFPKICIVSANLELNADYKNLKSWQVYWIINSEKMNRNKLVISFVSRKYAYLINVYAFIKETDFLTCLYKNSIKNFKNGKISKNIYTIFLLINNLKEYIPICTYY